MIYPNSIKQSIARISSLLVHPVSINRLLPTVCSSPIYCHQCSQQTDKHTLMDPDILAAVTALHSSDVKTVIHFTGGGGILPGYLLGVSGASGTVLEISCLYAKESCSSALRRCYTMGHDTGGTEERRASGQKSDTLDISYAPRKFVSAETAYDLAYSAYLHACELQPENNCVVGLGATAAVVTSTPRRGLHHAYIAAYGQQGLLALHINMKKNVRTRIAEDNIIARGVVYTLCRYGQLAPSFSIFSDHTHQYTLGETAPPGEDHTMILQRGRQEGERGEGHAIDVFYDRISTTTATTTSTTTNSGGGAGSVAVRFDPDPNALRQGGEIMKSDSDYWKNRVVLCGSFNPLHQGHIAMLESAEKITGCRGSFELGIGNADKPSMTRVDVLKRVYQFRGVGKDVIVTNAGLFIDKAPLLPGVIFGVGYDTADRVLNPIYYNDSQDEMIKRLSQLHQDYDTKFLVFGRADLDSDGSVIPGGHFHTLEDLQVPSALSSMFIGVGETDFRRDISSSMLRKQGRER